MKLPRQLKSEINRVAHTAGIAHAKKVKAALMAKASHCLGNGESFNMHDFPTFAEAFPDVGAYPTELIFDLVQGKMRV